MNKETNVLLDKLAEMTKRDFDDNIDEFAAAAEPEMQREEFTAIAVARRNEHIAARASRGTAIQSEPVEVATAAEINRPDMPATVLCGKLGEWCRTRMDDFPLAYAWPAMLCAASVTVKPHPNPKLRCNIYAAPVGPVGSGKSEAPDRAEYLFGLEKQFLLVDTKFGSAEGMLEGIGDREGSPVLWSPDELSHTLEKAQIQGASFPMVLNTIFYKDQNKVTVAKRKPVTFYARLTIIGGVVEENFGNSFSSATTMGLYDRFLFGLCPSGFQYFYRPYEGKPLFELQLPFDNGDKPSIGPRPETPRFHSEVWNIKNAIQKDEEISGRLLELVMRCALVCGAWDEIPEIRAPYLEPFWELARYQKRLRAYLQPNPGKSHEAMAAYKILAYLNQHADSDKWITWRNVYRDTHVMEYGPSVVNRALSAMVFSGDVEETYAQPGKNGKKTHLVRRSSDK